jgi:hypothetical protein
MNMEVYIGGKGISTSVTQMDRLGPHGQPDT